VDGNDDIFVAVVLERLEDSIWRNIFGRNLRTKPGTDVMI
jgi:hypothetical protein